MIIVVRHGERADKASLQEQKKIQKQHDPHLTEIGKEQALNAGLRISELINEYRKNSKEKNVEVIIISSPFLRTIQTALIIAQNLAYPIYKETIYLQEEICETLFPHSVNYNYNVMKELHSSEKNLNQQMSNYFGELNKVQFSQESIIQNEKLIKPKYNEDIDYCSNRTITFLKCLEQSYFNQFNPDKQIFVLLTHLFFIDQVLQHYLQDSKTLFDIGYTGICQVIWKNPKQDPNEYEVILKGDYAHINKNYFKD